jgi:hypothetical protein
MARFRAQLGPRWLKELRFRRRFGGAPLIEMNPLNEDEVKRFIAPARVTINEREWFLIQR